MRDLRKVREQSQLRLTYTQFFALLGLMAVSLLLSGLLGYYLGRGATAAEKAAVATSEVPLIPEDVETESVATLLALARERRRDGEERLRLDYHDLLPQSDQGVPQALREPKAAPQAEPPIPREVEPDHLVEEDGPEGQGDASAEAAPPDVGAPEDRGEAPRSAPEHPDADAAQPDAEEPADGRFVIQVSSFQREDQANSLVDDLKRKGFAAYALKADVNGRTWYRVRVGGFPTKDEATAELNRLALIRSDLRPMVTNQ